MRLAMTYRFTVFVHVSFDVDADRARAFVQDGELGLVVEESSHLKEFK